MKSMITLLFPLKKFDILLALSWQGPPQLKCNSWQHTYCWRAGKQNKMCLHKIATECLYKLVSLGTTTDKKSATVNHQSCTGGMICNSKGLGKCSCFFWMLPEELLQVHKVHFLAGSCTGNLRAPKEKTEAGVVHKVYWVSNSLGLHTATAKDKTLHGFITDLFFPHPALNISLHNAVASKRMLGLSSTTLGALSTKR